MRLSGSGQQIWLVGVLTALLQAPNDIRVTSKSVLMLWMFA